MRIASTSSNCTSSHRERHDDGSRVNDTCFAPARAKPCGHKKDLGFPDRKHRAASADRSPRGRHPSGHASQTMKTVLYCRVSTVDQTLDDQRTQAQQSGYTPDLVLADHGVSGISTRLCERPEGRRLFDILRGGDTLVVRWVDRLGRNYEDVTDAVREFIRRGIRVETVINRMTFDGATTDPMQQAIRDSLIAFMAPMVLKQAAQLFKDGLTVREVAATLRISKTEAGRLRLRAVADGLLLAETGALLPRNVNSRMRAMGS